MKEIVLASSNSGKIAELKAILSPIRCIPQKDLGIHTPEETGLTFIENAILKARYASIQSNKPSLADDSGLVVEALEGQPGVYSARFAGINASDDENIDLLFHKLKEIPENNRKAYFYSAIAVVRFPEDPMPLIATGKWEGRIVMQRSGQLGFGYDPVFYIDSEKCTAASLSPEIKNTISHRAKALKQLKDYLIEL